MTTDRGEAARHRSELIASGPLQIFTERAREITEFCLKHGGKAFEGWQVEKIFAYVFFHVVARTVFVVRQGADIAAIAFAWARPAADIQERAAAGTPQFDWRRTEDQADGLFVAQVIRQRSEDRSQKPDGLARIVKLFTGRWADFGRRRVFTYRQKELVELKHGVIERLINHQPSTINRAKGT